MVDNILIFAATEAGAGEGSPVVVLFDKFGIELPFLIAQIINFVVVAFVLYKFAFKPVLETLEERQKKISDGLKFSEEAEVKLAESEKEKAATIQKAQQEAQAIMAGARENAKAYLEKQTQEASGKAEEIISKAKEAIALERKKMLLEVRDEVTRLVVDTSSKVLSKNLSDDEKSRFSKSATAELSSVGS